MKTTLFTLGVACLLSLMFVAAEKRRCSIAAPVVEAPATSVDVSGLCLNYEPSGPRGRQNS